MIARTRELLAARIGRPLAHQLKRGATPSLLAWSVALGVAFSVLPLPGTTTVLCLLIGLLLRLNPVAIQAANFAAAPLQLLLLLPFVQAGQRLFGDPPLPLSRADLRAALALGVRSFFSRFGVALAHGVVIWAVAAPLVAIALHLILRPLFARAIRESRRPEALPAGPDPASISEAISQAAPREIQEPSALDNRDSLP